MITHGRNDKEVWSNNTTKDSQSHENANKQNQMITLSLFFDVGHFLASHFKLVYYRLLALRSNEIKSQIEIQSNDKPEYEGEVRNLFAIC